MPPTWLFLNRSDCLCETKPNSDAQYRILDSGGSGRDSSGGAGYLCFLVRSIVLPLEPWNRPGTAERRFFRSDAGEPVREIARSYAVFHSNDFEACAMTAPSVLSLFPKPEDLLALTPEDLGGVIIEV